MLLGQRLYFFRCHVTRDDQHGIGGRVKGPVEIDRLLAVELLHLLHPADHRLLVGVRMIEHRIELLAQEARGIVIDTLAALFEDDVTLGQNGLVLRTRFCMRSASRSIIRPSWSWRFADSSRYYRGS